jgi:hypothetical protein
MSGNYPNIGEKDLVRIVQSIRDLFQGRTNASGEFFLAVSPATTTVVASFNCGIGSKPLLTPLSANAALAMQVPGGVWVSAINSGSFTVTHPASVQTDRKFGYVALG